MCNSFDLSKAFENLHTDTKVEIFHWPVLNIINNFAAKKIITVDDGEEHSQK